MIYELHVNIFPKKISVKKTNIYWPFARLSNQTVAWGIINAARKISHVFSYFSFEFWIQISIIVALFTLPERLLKPLNPIKVKLGYVWLTTYFFFTKCIDACIFAILNNSLKNTSYLMICWLNDYDYAASCRIGSISAIILLCGHVGLITAASWKKMCFVLNVWDSNSYVRDTKSYLKYSVRLSCSYIYDIVTYDSVFRMYDLVSLTYDSVFRMYD